VISKNDQAGKNDNKIFIKKDIKDSNPKLPPKPQGANSVNYKLPPKKPTGQYDPSYKQEVKYESKKSIESGSRPQIARSNRSNSVQRVIYPSWWG
jgi:hypothetical protein